LQPRTTDPTTIRIPTFSRSWASDPAASFHLCSALETPMSAAAGMVVTEMNTPIGALVRDSVRETTPTMPSPPPRPVAPVASGRWMTN
jgi:hypothetical protein